MLTADYSKSIEYKFNSDFFIDSPISNSNISKVLSKTEMAEVYLVFDEITECKYILKVIRNFSQLINETTLQSIMEMECEQIVKILDYKIENNDLYLIKEYVEGELLDHIASRNVKLIESDLKNIMLQLCYILEYLHTFKMSKLILRDIKPSNIIYQNDGKIKLIDLISIRSFKEESTNDTLYVGTAGFAAPEQFGFKQSDERTDIYNLGATIYYLATKQFPIWGNQKILPISKLRNDLSSSFSKVVSKCIEFKPKDRYRKTQDIKRELEKNNIKKYRIFLLISWVINIITITIITLSLIHISNQSKLVKTLNSEISDFNLSTYSTHYKGFEITPQEWVFVVGDKDDHIFKEMENVLGEKRNYKCMGIDYIRDEFFWAEAVADIIVFTSNIAYQEYPKEIRNFLDYPKYQDLLPGEFIGINYYTDSQKRIKMIFVNPN